MGVNVEELEYALAVTEVAATNDMWQQMTWLARTSCGTAGCFAGNYLLSLGYEAHGDSRYPHQVKTPEGRIVDVRNQAAELLGLSHYQADRLFSAHNSLDDLRRIVNIYVEMTKYEEDSALKDELVSA